MLGIGVKMNSSTIYILVSILALAIVALLIFVFRGENNKNKLTPLAGLAFSFIVSGIIFGESRLVGYSLMGVGLVLAVIDIFVEKRKR
jgi:hypothetical protein